LREASYLRMRFSPIVTNLRRPKRTPASASASSLGDSFLMQHGAATELMASIIGSPGGWQKHWRTRCLLVCTVDDQSRPPGAVPHCYQCQINDAPHAAFGRSDTMSTTRTVFSGPITEALARLYFLRPSRVPWRAFFCPNKEATGNRLRLSEIESATGQRGTFPPCAFSPDASPTAPRFPSGGPLQRLGERTAPESPVARDLPHTPEP
jgi:hypothetical protein